MPNETSLGFLKDAPPFQTLDYVYIAPTFLSITASLTAAYLTYRSTNSKRSPLYISQITLFGALALYHFFCITVYYMEMINFDRRVTNFDAFYGLRLTYVGLFIVLDMFLFSALIWLMLFWNKIMSVHFLSIVNPLLSLLNNTEVIRRLIIIGYVVIFIIHIVFLSVAFDDGIRVRMLCLCIEGSIESVLTIVTGFLSLDMMGLILRVRIKKDMSRDIAKAVSKMCFTCAFACIANILGFLTAFSIVAKNADRLGRNYPPNQVGSDVEPFVSIRIDPFRFLWGFNGLIISIPFLFKQSQQIKRTTNIHVDPSAIKTTAPVQSSINK